MYLHFCAFKATFIFFLSHILTTLSPYCLKHSSPCTCFLRTWNHPSINFLKATLAVIQLAPFCPPNVHLLSKTCLFTIRNISPQGSPSPFPPLLPMPSWTVAKLQLTWLPGPYLLLLSPFCPWLPVD